MGKPTTVERVEGVIKPIADEMGYDICNIQFAKEALSSPMAHMMIGKYSVLDNSSQRLILLRSPQNNKYKNI